jgi:hypothetical protein
MIGRLARPPMNRSEVLLTCDECAYVTNYQPWKTAKSLHRHCRKFHRIDPDGGQQRILIAVSAAEGTQRSGEGKMFDM